jgi:hypothetical protein
VQPPFLEYANSASNRALALIAWQDCDVPKGAEAEMVDMLHDSHLAEIILEQLSKASHDW